MGVQCSSDRVVRRSAVRRPKFDSSPGPPMEIPLLSVSGKEIGVGLQDSDLGSYTECLN
jgi:hypothetical protein